MIPTFALGGLSLGRAQAAGGGGGPAGDHRYWRITNITVAGAYFEPSEVQLWIAGSNANGSATVTSSAAPGFGSLADILDGNTASTRCYWSDSTVEVGESFWIKWDFGSDAAVEGAKIGEFDESNRFPSSFDIQYSDDDSSWTTAASFSGITSPGSYTLSSLFEI